MNEVRNAQDATGELEVEAIPFVLILLSDYRLGELITR